MREHTRSAEALVANWAKVLMRLVRWKMSVFSIEREEWKGSQTLLVLRHIRRLGVQFVSSYG